MGKSGPNLQKKNTFYLDICPMSVKVVSQKPAIQLVKYENSLQEDLLGPRELDPFSELVKNFAARLLKVSFSFKIIRSILRH